MERTRTISTPGFERTLRRLGLLAASAALFAACAGGGATTAPATTTPATTTPATVAPATMAPETQAASGLLALGSHPSVGSYVIGANGMSLYLFTNDTGSASTCTGECAVNWPPLIVAAASDATAGPGISGAVGTITRDDGTLQVTLAGHPLYYFKNDAAAGDVNGQGINSVWWLVAADGSALGANKPTTAPGQSKCSGPTCY
jgi:predicted lipoprotein with Yx(FWY)xxD motif